MLLAPGLACRPGPTTAGLVVVDVDRFSGAPAVQPGDRLLGWERQHDGRVTEQGLFRSWEQVEEADLLQGPHRGVVLVAVRGGRPLRIAVGNQRWWIDVRPALAAPALARVERARASAMAGRLDVAERELAALATELPATERPWAWRRLGMLAAQRSDWARAAAAYGRGAALGTGAVRAELLVEQGLARRRRGDHTGAVHLLEEAVAWRGARPGEELATAWILVQLGNTYERLAENEDAERAFGAALAIYARAAPASYGAAGAHNGFGNLALERRDLGQAEASFRAALRIAPENPSSWINLAKVADLRGDFARAEDHLERAAAASTSLRGSKVDHVWLEIADLRLRKEDWAGARVAYRRYREEAHRQSPGHPGIAYGDVGLCRAALGEHDLVTAGRWCEQALVSGRRGAGGDLEGLILEALGEVALARGELGRAREQLDAAIRVRRATAPATLDLARALALRARVERRAGQPAAALDLLAEALSTASAQEARLGGGELTPVPFRASVAWIAREQVDLLVALGRAPEAFVALERSRAQSLRSLLAESGHGGGHRTPAAERERRELAAELDRVYAELARLPATDARSGRARLRLEELLDRWDGLVAREPRRVPSEPAALADVQRALPVGGLLVSYSLGPESGHVFTLPADGPLRVHELRVGSKALAPRIERLRERYAAGSRRDGAGLDRMAAELAALLLDPASPEIGAARSLVIVPDAPLQALSFAGLPERATGEPLIAAHSLQIVASASLLVELDRRPRRPRPWHPLALVDPATAAEETTEGAAPPALGGARNEAAVLARLFPGTRLIAGRGVTEAAWHREAPAADLVHVGVHAVLDERLPLGSALLLSPDANDSGRLHAWELVEGTELRAELVTLAACDSARGVTLPGEGLLGLTWALQRGGARAVLGALWPVDDEVTAAFMERFYRRLAAGEAKAEALRAAQLELRSAPVVLDDGRRLDLRHPRHWAAFVLIGA